MSRAIVENKGDFLRITIPTKNSIFFIVFMTMWLCGWTYGVLIVSNMLFLDGEFLVQVFLFSWLIGWVLGGLWVIYILMLQLYGREIIEIQDDVLTIEKSISGVGWQSTYETRLIENICEAPIPANPNATETDSAQVTWLFLNVGVLQFDYEGSTIKMGCLLEESEKRYILNEIKMFLSVNDV